LNPFRASTHDLEEHVTPNTTPKEREKQEQKMTTTMENMNTLEFECAQIYIDTMEVCKKLGEDRVQ
jgi:hypothetical protein